MERARDECLAGAGLAGDQHRGARVRDALDRVVDALHSVVTADDRVERVTLVEAAPQLGVLRTQLTLVERASQLIRAPRTSIAATNFEHGTQRCTARSIPSGSTPRS